MNSLISNYLRYPLACLLVALPLSIAHADAGKVLFVYGNAYVVSADGNRAPLNKGNVVDAGDTIVTSANGRVQLRMEDGGLLALRPQTEFVIESFNYPATLGGKAGTTGEPRSFFALVKGGFRSITGAIGKSDKSDYGVRTPVATIGIRGTDYTAVLCSADCGAGTVKGLYVGVTDGGVVLRNDGGSLDLDSGQFGFVAAGNAAPEKSTAAARLLAAEVAPEADEVDEDTQVAEVAVVGAGNDGDVNFTGGNGDANDNSGAVAYAAGPMTGADGFSGVSAQGTSRQATDTAGTLTSFDADSPLGNARIDQGNAQAINLGRDTDRSGATGLEWGRWTNGTVNVTSAAGSTSQSVDSSSLHWISGPADNATPQLPTSGSASFALVGNTNPTDNHGNVGTLGSASLSADFTSQTADAAVSLSFDETNQVWDANANDVDINSDATFAGDFDTVTVTDTTNGQSSGGEGDLSGFFSGDAAGNLTGAGMSYSLTDDDDSVSGAAAFQVVGDGK